MHVFSFCGLLLIFGCFCGIKYTMANIFAVILCFLFVFGIKLAIFRTKSMNNLLISIFLLVFVSGVCMGNFHHYRTFADVKHLYGTDVTLTGRVSEVTDKSAVVDTEYGRVRVFCYGGFSVEIDDTVTVTGNLSGYEVAQYNGDFDSCLYNARQGIVGYVECDLVEVTGHNKSFSLWDVGAKVRNHIQKRVEKFPAGSDVKGFLTALLTGDTEFIEDDLKENFRLAGISHLTAVSGLHVGIFLSFFVLLSGRLRKNKYLYVGFVLVLVIFYVLVIGERASVFRAGIMAVLSYFIITMRCRSDSTVNLVIAGLLICFSNPYYATDPGFQLSFLATLGIVMFAEFLRFPAISVPFAVTIFMLPVTVYYYNTISLETVLVNILVLPFVPIVIFFGYAGCIIPPLSLVACNISNVIIWVAEGFAKLDFLHITLPSSQMHHFIIWFLLVCAFYMAFTKQKYIGVIFVVCCAALGNFAFADRTYENACSFRFVNCGSFNMQHITTSESKNILVDCGGDAVDYAVKRGIGEIYMVVATENLHGRYDNISALADNYTVYNVFLPESAKDKNLHLENCNVLYYNQEEDYFTVDEVEFKFVKRDGEKSLVIKAFDDVVAVPFGKTVAHMGTCTVLCMPDKCIDGMKAAENSVAKYYVHPTYQYEAYDVYNKYITPQIGMVEMIFRDNREPVVYTKKDWRYFFD